MPTSFYHAVQGIFRLIANGVSVDELSLLLSKDDCPSRRIINYSQMTDVDLFMCFFKTNSLYLVLHVPCPANLPIQSELSTTVLPSCREAIVANHSISLQKIYKNF